METERPSRPLRPPPPQRNASPAQEPVESSSQTTYKHVQRLHDNAYRHVNFGLEADERGSIQEAAESYKFGLQILNDALLIDVEHLTNSSSEQRNNAKEMQQKMLKTKQQITFRLQTLESEGQEAHEPQAIVVPSAPPSYEQAMSDTNSNISFDADMQALESSLMDDEPDSLDLTNTINLFSIEDGVQIFYISAEGYVSAPSYPSALHILRFEDDANVPGNSTGNQRPPAFLHVGDWLYPLVPGSSPVLQTNFGAYMFPDLMSPQAGAAVGLILPPQERGRFEQVVRNFTVYQQESEEAVATDTTVKVPSEDQTSQEVERDEGKDMASKISRGILIAADWISWGVGKGAEKAGEMLKNGSEKLRDRIKPSDKVHKMDPRLHKGVVIARQTTHATVQVTGYLINKLGQATSALAREIAPHIRKGGEKFIPKTLTKENPNNGKSKLDGVIEVAASGIQGFGTVYLGLESAAKTLGRSIANETVQIVHHRYGEDAGNLAENSVYAAGNVAMTAMNARSFGIKAVAKRTAKDTGKAVLEDLNQNQSRRRGYNSCESDVDPSPSDGAHGSVYPKI